MPSITINEEIFIPVEDFLDECSEKEIQKIINYLTKMRFINNNIQDEEWNTVISKLEKSRLLLSNEEEEIIKNITKRF